MTKELILLLLFLLLLFLIIVIVIVIIGVSALPKLSSRDHLIQI